MYIPSKFKNKDTQQIFEFCDRYSFASIVSTHDDEIIANHFPLIFDPTRGDRGTLIGHMAKGNPQWKHWSSNTQVLCIFSGLNRYISPKWYQDPLNVPTWNYAVVHMNGNPKVIEDHDGIEIILKQLVDKHESLEGTNWQYNLPEDFRRDLTKAIIGFEIEVSHVEAKFKLSQNRDDKDRQSAIKALLAKQDPNSQNMAELMKQHWPERYSQESKWPLTFLDPTEKKKCEVILRSLPKWFGIEEAIKNYVQDIANMETWGAYANGSLIGFVTINFHSNHTAEIHVMGILEDYHGQGLGSALVKSAESAARRKGCEFLSVKTLSPSRNDPNYAKTRKFYLACGFRIVEEFKTLWGEANPCLLMIKGVAP